MEEGMEDFRVLAGTANPALAAAIAAELSVPLAGCRIERFPDGEIDDMISTGGTILKAVEALHQAGARPQIRVVATHGVFAEGSRERLMASGSQGIVVTDSVAIPDTDPIGLRRLTVAPLLATALRRLADGDSLRDLY
jgi:phosphoribosylpyrophosphate synthetase